MANWGVFGKMPSIQDLENPSASLASEVIADDGTVMGKYYLEDRTNIDFKDISKHIINAFVATEDERFYNHSGIDGRGLARAVVHLVEMEVQVPLLNNLLLTYLMVTGQETRLQGLCKK